jgi:hypothetical protein
LRIGWLDLADLFPLSANNVVLLQKLYVLRLCQPALNQALELLFVHLELISYEMNRLRFVVMQSGKLAYRLIWCSERHRI